MDLTAAHKAVDEIKKFIEWFIFQRSCDRPPGPPF
jgi:hypothetical protein